MRTIRLPLVLLALGAAACQPDSFPTTSPTNVAGTYKLTTINSLPLPFSFRPDSSRVSGTGDTTVNRETLYRDEYELLPSGRFHYTTVDSAVVHLSNGSADTKTDFSSILAGSWSQQSTFVLLTADSITTPGSPEAPLSTPQSFSIPIPSSDGISGTTQVSHKSLGSSTTVVVNYTFFYAKQ